MLYIPPVKIKNYSIGHKSETAQPKTKKKCSAELHIFTPLYKFLGQIQNNECNRNLALFEIWQIDT